jgi:hypothetical protein
MRRTITVYTCDHTGCGKELATAADGIVLDGLLYTPGEKHKLRSKEPSRDAPSEPHALCWEHFHELFPSPQIRAWRDEMARGYERGGPGDR